MMSTTTSAFALRPAEAADKPLVLQWRNHPEVRKVMFTTHEITTVEHEVWWQGTLNDASYRLMICLWEGEPVGIVSLSHITRTGCDWAFYFNPEAFSHGLLRLKAWQAMELASLRYVQDVLNCSMVRCEVFAFNSAVLSMHLRHGFAEAGRYSRKRDGEWLDVIQLQKPLL